MPIDYMRRCDINRMTPAETAIRSAILAVEALGADERLTDVVVRLIDCQKRLADWADETGNVKPEEAQAA